MAYPGWIMALAVVGAIVVYLFIGWLLYRIAKEIWNNLDEILAGLVLMLWPLAVAVGVIFVIGKGLVILLSAIYSIIYWFFMYFSKLLRLGITGVEIDDLVKSERKIERKIDESKSEILGAVSDHIEVYHPPKPIRKPRKSTKPKKPSKKKAKK